MSALFATKHCLWLVLHIIFVCCCCCMFLTEKNESSHQRHNRQHNDGKVTYLGSLLGLPVEWSIGIAVQKTKQNNNQTYIHR